MGSRERTTLFAAVALVALCAGIWMAVRMRDRASSPAADAGVPLTSAGASDPAGASGATVRLFKTPEDVPAFRMTAIDGRTLSSTDWHGKVVLINFWATWCPPCRAEIPDLIALQKKYQDKLVVIGVSEDEIPVDAVKKFADAQGMNYPVVMTSPEIRKLFRGVAALPTTFVLDRDGRLAQKHVGMLNPVGTEAEARVLAGLDTTTKIERVENSDKARVENAAEAMKIPGVDLTKLNETQKKAVVQALLTEECTCGCGLTLAVCRLDDPTCPVSLPAAQEIVKKYSALR